MTDLPVKNDSAIEGVFYGFNPHCLYKLQDGSYWLQTGQTQIHHHAYNPGARILDLDDGLFLQVDDLEKMVPVQQVHDVIASQIQGKFSGWTGRTAYTLTNGQVWQQAKYLKKYAVKYMPAVLIYPTLSGPVMQVAGTRVPVRQIG